MQYKDKYEGFSYELKDHIMVVTFNRPEKLNVFQLAIMRDLTRMFTAMDDDPEVRCVILTGEGKAFCAGADLAEEADLDLVEIDEYAGSGYRMTKKIDTFRTPVIAAVNGYALGGGFEVALAADYRIASEKAQMSLPEVTFGTFSGWGGLERMLKLIRPSIAKRLLYTGERVRADEALKIGLVDEVVAPQELMDKALELAGKIAANPPLAVAINKRFARELGAYVVTEGLRVYESEDLREAFAAFFEKRQTKPFAGR